MVVFNLVQGVYHAEEHWHLMGIVDVAAEG